MANLSDKAPIFVLLDLIHGIPEDKIKEIEIHQEADLLELPPSWGSPVKEYEAKGNWITIRMYVAK